MKYKLGQLGTVYSGGTPSTKNAEFWDGDIAWITPKDLAGYSKKKISKGERNITNAGLLGSSANLIPAGSVLMSSRAPIGYVAIANNELSTNQGFKSINCDERICLNEYIYYWIKSNIEYIKSKANGSTFKEISGNSFKNLDVDVPDLEAQKKIVRILSALDQKIELNNQLDLTIHNNLNAIFEDWFIRKNYNGDQSKWKKEKLGNFVTINRGLSYKGQFLSGSGTPMINLGNIMPGGFFRSEKNKYYTGEFKNKVIVKAGDLVMANTDMTQKREVLGTPLIVPSIYDGDVIFSHHIYSIKSEKIPTLFLYYLLLRKDFSDAAGGGATGTTVLFLPKDIIENYEFVLPDDAAINRFVDIAKKVLQRRNNIMHENTALETIRDALLPRLMSSEISLEKVKI